MNIIYFNIAIRYLFSKKRINIVNIVVGLSIISFSISTFSLSIILFIFSGLENLSKNFFYKNYPDISISFFDEKKLFTDDLMTKIKLKSIKGIETFSRSMKINIILEDDNKKKHFLYLKGIDPQYENVVKNFKKVDLINFKEKNSFPIYIGLTSMSHFFQGLPLLYDNYNNKKINNSSDILFIKLPSMKLIFLLYKNGKPFFIQKKIFIKGLFHFGKMNDSGHIFCDILEIQNLMKNKCFQTIDIKVNNNVNITKIKKNLKDKLGKEFNIKSREDQEESFYKIVKTEKIFIYFLFSLISLITGFNLYSAIFILQLDKKEQIFLLWSFGYSKINKIFLHTGFIITVFGWFIGILLSLFVSILQNTYKIFKISENIIFPIKLTSGNLFLVTCTILTIGFILSFLSSERTTYILRN
ncbi:ABC transporter permease [Blattabacterium cuenoti]|uniref:ABC transporter permease n=1 Tax=Blattabacterium cuenoti TaxID=1653831 RepID=UPI00163C4C55|nr:ABC transporter permease [Blattabacterium cuenoti]